MGRTVGTLSCAMDFNAHNKKGFRFYRVAGWHGYHPTDELCDVFSVKVCLTLSCTKPFPFA